MRIGIQLPEVERKVRWPEYAAMARAAEEAGFDSIWVGDRWERACHVPSCADVGALLLSRRYEVNAVGRRRP